MGRADSAGQSCLACRPSPVPHSCCCWPVPAPPCASSRPAPTSTRFSLPNPSETPPATRTNTLSTRWSWSAQPCPPRYCSHFPKSLQILVFVESHVCCFQDYDSLFRDYTSEGVVVAEGETDSDHLTDLPADLQQLQQALLQAAHKPVHTLDIGRAGCVMCVCTGDVEMLTR